MDENVTQVDEFEQAFGNVGDSSQPSTVEDNSQAETEVAVPTENEEATTSTKETTNEVPPQNNSNVGNEEEQRRISAEEERHRQNHINAQRRIRNRENTLRQKDERIRKLEERLARYESKSNPNEFDSMKMDNIREQIEDEQESYNQEQRAYAQERLYAFNDQVAQEVGYESAQIAVPMIQRWADYVNENERELVKLTSRPYGKHLLYEWCTRMESSPTAKSAWESMTGYEKSRKLTELYELVKQAHTPRPQNASTPTEPPKNEVKNVGVAESGRGNTLNQPASSDDFGTAIERQMQKLGVRKF